MSEAANSVAVGLLLRKYFILASRIPSPRMTDFNLQINMFVLAEHNQKEKQFALF